VQPPAGGLRDSTARSEIVATKTSRGWANDETLSSSGCSVSLSIGILVQMEARTSVWSLLTTGTAPRLLWESR